MPISMNILAIETISEKFVLSMLLNNMKKLGKTATIKTDNNEKNKSLNFKQKKLC
ncbi:protein of unknown function [Brevefilum fermentans]|uniref:Uncharacterized protein n=1 Tax=Candidatus Brevifilum fermentans TaxID=1986204 RepID=A0A1Y6K6K0_9CHLR|nr:protein of unknown function [Brevefilum fermentans]